MCFLGQISFYWKLVNFIENKYDNVIKIEYSQRKIAKKTKIRRGHHLKTEDTYSRWPISQQKIVNDFF